MKLLDDAVEARSLLLGYFGHGAEWKTCDPAYPLDDSRESYWGIERSTVYMYDQRDVKFFQTQHLTGNNNIRAIHRGADYTLIEAFRNSDGKTVLQVLDNNKEISLDSE